MFKGLLTSPAPTPKYYLHGYSRTFPSLGWSCLHFLLIQIYTIGCKAPITEHPFRLRASSSMPDKTIDDDEMGVIDHDDDSSTTEYVRYYVM